MSSKDVVEIYELLSRFGVHIWVDGGWGVDALLGKQTRSHKDLDIAVEAKDVLMLRRLLASRSFEEIKLDEAKLHNFVLGDAAGREVDVHVIVLDENGNGIYGPIEDGLMYPAPSLTGMGTIDGTPVRCISPEWVVKFHSGYALKEKDLQDVSAICERFGIELPGRFRYMKPDTN